MTIVKETGNNKYIIGKHTHGRQWALKSVANCFHHAFIISIHLDTYELPF